MSPSMNSIKILKRKRKERAAVPLTADDRYCGGSVSCGARKWLPHSPVVPHC